MNQCLFDLYRAHAVTWDEAMSRSRDPEDLKRMAQRDGAGM